MLNSRLMSLFWSLSSRKRNVIATKQGAKVFGPVTLLHRADQGYGQGRAMAEWLCMYVCMYVCMRVCMCVSVSVWGQGLFFLWSQRWSLTSQGSALSSLSFHRYRRSNINCNASRHPDLYAQEPPTAQTPRAAPHRWRYISQGTGFMRRGYPRCWNGYPHVRSSSSVHAPYLRQKHVLSGRDQFVLWRHGSKVPILAQNGGGVVGSCHVLWRVYSTSGN